MRDLIEFMAEKGVEIRAEKVSGDDWMEIDFPEEYEFAKNVFIHGIKKIDLEKEYKNGEWPENKR